MAEFTNRDRARAALEGVKKFASQVYTGGMKTEEIDTIIQDLLTDLHHLADAKRVDWQQVTRRAEGNYREEVREERRGY